MMSYKILPKWGCFQSYDKEGNPLIYSGSEWECKFWTEKVLSNKLSIGTVVNDGKVGGKL